jgi:hypothetical protein
MGSRRFFTTVAVFGSLVLLGVVAIAIVLGSSDNREPQSGIRGVLLVGCPGDRPCGWFGKSASQDVFRYASRGRRLVFVKRFRSASDGSFEVALPPGRYLIREPVGQSLGLPVNPRPHVIVVRRSQMTEVDFAYDTGMR